MTGSYRGRIAPSPTGYMHLGHAATFWTALERARQHQGLLVLRNEDLDVSRCRPEFVEAMIEDLRWFGLVWQEGPDIDGPFAPYNQNERRETHLAGWHRLLEGGFIYPCSCSRREVLEAAGAPHAGEEEPLYPGICRPTAPVSAGKKKHTARSGVSWRFRIPDGEEIAFVDEKQGPVTFTAGRDFGDFVVWRKDDMPAYQLAVVLDDHAMQISEVVRGADLLLSTARQILLYRALGLPQPTFFHCPLVTDENGLRLAKRHQALSLRSLREQGRSPEELRESVQNQLA